MMYSLRHVLAVMLILVVGLSEAFAVSPEDTEGREANRLINEPSPYLRQHAYNPIDWYPWGEEAFQKAREENKPIFLSVGYSTCHWCHVMERESFRDEKIAEILNASFVSIKVDRERRPDVDETYMLATQLITGRGGWPNTVFMTPELKPFYGGTYFPPDDFKSLIVQASGLWARQQRDLESDAHGVAEKINTIMTRRVEAAEITPEVLAKATDAIMQEYDLIYGGFGDAPKFPQEPVLLFLLRKAEKDGRDDLLDAAAYTLESILNGGIQDQAGGGFHRYAVDPRWKVPHFEKMLYNQALITKALVRTYRLTGQERFAAAIRRTLDYVLVDMTASEGGFYSARDADSGEEEGTFYVWNNEQLEQALSADDAAFAETVFGVTLEGNFKDGATVLHFAKPPETLAKELQMNTAEFNGRVDDIRAKLTKARAGREAPLRDEKVVTSWNGMMIMAFAEAAAELYDKRYRDAAVKAGTFMWEKLRVDGELKRTYFEGSANLEGQQEDHAFGALGFIALYDLTGERAWLSRAETLISEMVKNFRDEDAGDYFMTASANTFSKAKARSDAGTPSGNGAALEAFAKLAQRTSSPDHRINGEALLAAVSGIAVRSPRGNAYSLLAADELLRGGAGPRQFLSKGVVDVRAVYNSAAREVSLKVRLADGWHINSNTPLEDFFVPTELSVEGKRDAKIVYPAHKTQKLGFHDKDLALYEGTVELTAGLAEAPEKAVTVNLRVQACSDKVCLEPETARLRVPVHDKPAG